MRRDAFIEIFNSPLSHTFYNYPANILFSVHRPCWQGRAYENFADVTKAKQISAQARKRSEKRMITSFMLFLLFQIPVSAPPLPHCKNVPPVCAGGLLPQTAKDVEINAYLKKYNLTPPLKCRMIESPRCSKHEVKTCQEQCTK